MRLSAAIPGLSGSHVLARLTLGCCLVVTSLLAVYLFHTSIYPIKWETLRLSSVSQDQGNAFVSHLPNAYWGHLDGRWTPQLLESGKPLGPGSSSSEDIRKLGLGRYSFRGDYVSFSSSDNSDPRANGREYEARGPLFIRSRLVLPLYLLAALSWVLALYFRESRRRIGAWGTMILSLANRIAALFVDGARRVLTGPGKSAARGVSRCTKSLWLSAGILLALLGLTVYRGVASSAISLSDPTAWQVLLPVLAREIGVAARDGHTVTVIMVALVLLPAYSRSGLAGTVTSLGLTVVLFLAPILGLWSTGYTDPFVIGGLLPWSDPNGYYWDASRLLEGSNFSSFSSRRPIFAGVLGTILGLTQHNLQLALVVIAVIVGISCFLAARAVTASHGAASGVTTLMLLFLFSREFAGETVTENLGISLGAISIALLWRGAWQRRMTVIWLGMLLLTLALNARAGAFLVLPSLLLWGTWHFRGGSRLSIRFLAGGCVALSASFLLNLLLLRFVGSPGGAAFSNFSYTLYGVVTGGRGWAQVLVDHPELASLREPQSSNEIYRLAFEAFRHYPLGLVIGSVNAYKDFFNPQASGVFNFVYVWDESWQATATRLFLYALSGIGLLLLVARKRDPSYSMMLAAVLGILVSVPLVPPIDSDQMRVYAATVPLVAVLAALGLYGLLRGMRSPSLATMHDALRFPRVEIMFGVGLTLLCLLGPIAAKAVSQPSVIRQAACRSGEESLQLRVAPGSSVQLVPDDSLRQSFLPYVRLSDFKQQLTRASLNKLYPELVDELASIRPGKTILLALDLADPVAHGSGDYGALTWTMVDTDMVPAGQQIIDVCAKPAEDTRIRGYRFYNADSVGTLSLH